MLQHSTRQLTNSHSNSVQSFTGQVTHSVVLPVHGSISTRTKFTTTIFNNTMTTTTSSANSAGSAGSIGLNFISSAVSNSLTGVVRSSSATTDDSPPPTPPVRNSSLWTSAAQSDSLGFQHHSLPPPLPQHFQSNSSQHSQRVHSLQQQSSHLLCQQSLNTGPIAHQGSSHHRSSNFPCLITSQSNGWPFAPGFTGKRKNQLAMSSRLSPIDDDGGFKSLETLLQHKRNSISCATAAGVSGGRAALFSRYSQPPLPPITTNTKNDFCHLSSLIDHSQSLGHTQSHQKTLTELHTAHPINVGTPLDSLLSDALDSEYQNIRSFGDVWSSSTSTRSSAYTAITSDYYTGSSEAMTTSPSLSSLSTCATSGGNSNSTCGSGARQPPAKPPGGWTRPLNSSNWTVNCRPPAVASGIALSSAVDRPKKQHSASILYYVVSKNSSNNLSSEADQSPANQPTHGQSMNHAKFAQLGTCQQDSLLIDHCRTNSGSSGISSLADHHRFLLTSDLKHGSSAANSSFVDDQQRTSGKLGNELNGGAVALRSSNSATDLKAIQKRAVYEFYLRHLKKDKEEAELGLADNSHHSLSDALIDSKFANGGFNWKSCSSQFSKHQAHSNNQFLIGPKLSNHGFAGKLATASLSSSGSSRSSCSSTAMSVSSSSTSTSPACASSSNSINSNSSPISCRSPSQSSADGCSPLPSHISRSLNEQGDEVIEKHLHVSKDEIGFTVTAHCAEVRQEVIYCNLPLDQPDSTDHSLAQPFSSFDQQQSEVSF